MKYKGILFDLDGVICDTAKLHYLAWKRLANELGGDITLEFNETLKGVDRTESLRRILAHINITSTEQQFEEMMSQKNSWYVESLENLSHRDILPGIELFINELKNNNIKIAIASASKNAPLILDAIGLSEQVDSIANPEHVINNKPAPDIFLLAAKQLNLEPYECIGLEDSQAGIDALNHGEINSIAVGNTLLNATRNISSTEQLTFELLETV